MTHTACKYSRADLLWAGLGATVSLFIFTPLFVYATNLLDAEISKYNILVAGSFAALPVTLGLYLLFHVPVVGNALVRLCQLMVVLVLILNIFPNHTGEFSGYQAGPGSLAEHLPLLKLSLLLVAGLWWAWWRPEQLNKVANALARLVLAACVLIAAILNSAADSDPRNDRALQASFHELGRESNIIVLILDAYTGYRAAEIFEKDPGLKSAFAGFQFFPRAIAPALNTAAGTSMILTGSMRLAIDEKNWLRKNTAALEDSFLALARQQGYGVSCISTLSVKDSSFEVANEQQFFTQPAPVSMAAFRNWLSFLAVSSFRVLPATAAEKFESLLTRLMTRFLMGEETDFEILQRTTDFAARLPISGKLAMDYLVENLRVGSENRKAVFMLSKISHPPWNFTRDGVISPGAGWEQSSVYALRATAALLDRLRQLESYDNAMIIIASDHGAIPVMDPSMGGVFQADELLPVVHNPLVMVKPVDGQDPLQVSQASVWLGDIEATVTEYLGLEPDTSATPSVVSLLSNPDVERVLDVPLFFKPIEDSYHSALKSWGRVNVTGTFERYGAHANIQPGKLLGGTGQLQMHAGIDTLQTSRMKSTKSTRHIKVYYASIKFDGLPLAELTESGMIVITRSADETDVQKFKDFQAGFAHLSRHDKAQGALAVGLNVPASIFEQHLPLAGEVEAGNEVVNFSYVAAPQDDEPSVQVSAGDVSLQVFWPGAENLNSE